MESRDLAYHAGIYIMTSSATVALEVRQATVSAPPSEVAAEATSDIGQGATASSRVSGLSLRANNSFLFRSTGQMAAAGTTLAAEASIYHSFVFRVTTPTTLRIQGLHGLGAGGMESFLHFGDTRSLVDWGVERMNLPVDVTVALEPDVPYTFDAVSHSRIRADNGGGVGEFYLDALLTFVDGAAPAPPPSTGVPCVTATQVGAPSLTALANGETRWRTRFDVRNGGSQTLAGVALAITAACTGASAAGGCPTASSRMRWDEASGRWAASADDPNGARPLQSERSSAVGAALTPRPEFNVNAGDHVAAFPVGTLAAGESRALHVDWAFAPGAPSTFHFQGQFLAQSGACSAAPTPVPALPGRSLGLLGVGLAAVAALATRRRRQSA